MDQNPIEKLCAVLKQNKRTHEQPLLSEDESRPAKPLIQNPKYYNIDY